MSTKVIAIANQKGGVGKTTTSVNLGVGLVNAGAKVLLIDCDAQGNLTQCMGISYPESLEYSLATLMYSVIADNELNLDECIKTHDEGVDLLPANIELSGIETSLVNTMSREFVLKNVINIIKDKREYDYIIIDCAPSLSMLTINALTAADEVIIPVQAHYLSAKGLELLLGTITKIRKNLNPQLNIKGILMTMHNNTNLAKQTAQLIEETYGKHIAVFNSTIPVSVKAAECSAAGKSIYKYNKQGKVAKAYADLTKEVLNNG